MENRLYPISEAFFKKKIEPLIFSNYKRPGRPPKTNHYTFFCGFLYVLRTGVSWRDLPSCFGPWHNELILPIFSLINIDINKAIGVIDIHLIIFHKIHS